jgi:hypothetical protein
MIFDKLDPYWVHIMPEKLEFQPPYDLEHYGKWLIYGSRKRMESLARALNSFVESGQIDQAKYTKRDPNIDPLPNRKMHVMCVYCDDRKRNDAWKILEGIGVKRKVWKYDKQTIADWSPGGRLEREARKFNRDENEKILRQCHSSEDLISLDCDYIARLGVKDIEKDIPTEQERIVSRIKQKYGIKDGTCASAILEFIKDDISFPGDCGYHFHSLLYKATGKWSRSTVDKNLKRLEEIGVLQRKYFRDLGEKYKTLFMYLFVPTEGKMDDLLRKRIFEINLHLPHSLSKPPGPKDSVKFTRIETIKEGDDLNLLKGEGIIDKVDLGKLSDKEKRTVVSDFIHGEFLETKTIAGYHYTHEQRNEIVGQVLEEAKKLPNINELYLVGSIPNNEERDDSDIDILTVRENCPGNRRCGARLKKAKGVDLFCFSKEEMEMARKRKLAILIGAAKLYENRI